MTSAREESRANQREQLAARIRYEVGVEVKIDPAEIKVMWEPIDTLRHKARITIPQRFWTLHQENLNDSVERAMRRVFGKNDFTYSVNASDLTNEEFAAHMQSRRK